MKWLFGLLALVLMTGFFWAVVGKFTDEWALIAIVFLGIAMALFDMYQTNRDSPD